MKKNCSTSIPAVTESLGFLKLQVLFCPINLLPERAKFLRQLGTTPEWFLGRQDQIRNLLENQELPQQEAEGSVSSLIRRFFDKAIAMNASDIHLEMQKDVLRVRFRIDGVLLEISRLPK